ncbi:HAD family hydrolase [Dysgonomonas massiliensis]|uniref:HAD family hydrolase n=1 Tax=Dysgonomonas massiliensis TaxID=2040292 RepID=UPI000C75D2F9|nr:HAD family phosphatase [Dysgonomonas massiliensis]
MAKDVKISTVLFGLDGVIVDTEKYYDKFWNKIAKENGLKIENFSDKIQGMTFGSIIDLYFAISPLEDKQAIRKALVDMESSIDYRSIVIPGVLEFIQYVREKDYRVGLVTSSSLAKTKGVLECLGLSDAFDTVVTSESIKKGKPDPMGYVLAQTNLGVRSADCVVFEDAFTGIKAATYAFMRVIGVATSLSADFLKDYTYDVIHDFTDTEKLKTFI